MNLTPCDRLRLHGGQQWPKVIGEAIAANDLLLLVWSHHAASSHFVELEWTTAMALRKTLLPCVLDETPLPPALRAINAVDARRLTAALPRIQEALHQLGPATAAAHDADDSALSHRRSLVPSWRKRWYMWITLLATLLSVLTILVALPGTIGYLFQQSAPAGRTLQALGGVIWDDTRETVEGVEVFLPEFHVTTLTDRQGKFVLQVQATPQRQVRLIARKEGYEPRVEDPTLGNTSLSFVLRRKP
jgi:hypothetical protein